MKTSFLLAGIVSRDEGDRILDVYFFFSSGVDTQADVRKDVLENVKESVPEIRTFYISVV